MVKESTSTKSKRRQAEGASALRPGGRKLRTLEQLSSANEEVFDASVHGRLTPKQTEQLNTVIKSQVKLRFDLPMRALQLWRDLQKAGIADQALREKFLQANPALKELVSGE